MKKILILFLFLGTASKSAAEIAPISVEHKMQHGFILSADDSFASHLVATGHHSRQVEITGHLIIESRAEEEVYKVRKSLNHDGHAYFLFQAQRLNLPSLQSGQVLTGHIIESEIGKYDSKNVIIKEAKFFVDRVLLNVINPFFTDDI